jgi:predicted RNA-binding Zn ribbon-like protein
MHWTVVDGFQMPNLIGGHPALDFCNTGAGWGLPRNRHREWLPDFDRLATWAWWADVVDRDTAIRLRSVVASDPSGASAVVERAHRLRADLYEFLTSTPRGDAPLGLVAAIDAARAAQRFAVAHGAAAWKLPERPDAILHATALQAASLLVEGDLDGIRRCPGDDCGWLFRSSQHRRWCSMASCGNRAKERAHARRERAAKPPISPHSRQKSASL